MSALGLGESGNIDAWGRGVIFEDAAEGGWDCGGWQHCGQREEQE